MILFRKELRNRIMTLLNTWAGPTSGTPNLKLIDNYLHDVVPTQLPYAVVYVRQMEPEGPSPIGVSFGQAQWMVHIYILDMDAVFDTGEDRMDALIGKIKKNLEADYSLNHLEVVDTDNHREYVYNTEITSILFDSSGVDGDHSFVSELYLTVYTDKS